MKTVAIAATSVMLGYAVLGIIGFYVLLAAKDAFYECFPRKPND